MRIDPRPLAVLLVALALTPLPAAAQVLEGTILEDGAGLPLPGTDVALLDGQGGLLVHATSDEGGAFALRAPGPGTYRLRIERLGYQTVTSDPFILRAGDRPSIDVHLVVQPVVMDPVQVEGEARDPRLARAGFYDRVAAGIGFFLTREEIEEAQADRLIDLFRSFRGGQVVSASSGAGQYDIVMRGSTSMLIRGGTCYPTVAVDGGIVRRGGPGAEVGTWDRVVHPDEVEAIEVYSGGAGLPAFAAGNTSPCGAIVIWTRR